MTREEKQKAINALQISTPVMAVTQEEFKDYIQTLNQIMDWLKQKPTTKNNFGVDLDKLKHKILMDVDGGTDDKWLRYADVCENISNSIDEFVADMREVEE